MLKSRLSAFLYLLGVFVSGAVVGALAHRLATVNAVLSGGPSKKADPEEVRKRVISDMKARLQLDDRQVSRLNQIMDQTREDFKQLHNRWNTEGQALREHQAAEVTEMLRPEQRPLYEQYRKDRLAARKRPPGDKK